ncbi:MAG: cell division FtsA domain-containing protein, partial [Clostridia bacterium]|nr:cell division FtsA domain-containing protein [Clostridia bacterium]
ALNSFPIGGGHITADLSETFNLSFGSAESLKNDIILSINSRRVDNYEVSTEDEIVPVPISIANNTVLDRINMIGTLVNKCLKLNQEENLEINAVYLTGSGLSYINGARECLSKRLGKDVNILISSMPSMAKPHFSSSLSVLYVALKEKNDSKPSWINWIKNLFKF